MCDQALQNLNGVGVRGQQRIAGLNGIHVPRNLGPQLFGRRQPGVKVGEEQHVDLFST
jgi:hypothetical protein